jgi:hypothetical protein
VCMAHQHKPPAFHIVSMQHWGSKESKGGSIDTLLSANKHPKSTVETLLRQHCTISDLVGWISSVLMPGIGSAVVTMQRTVVQHFRLALALKLRMSRCEGR